MPPVDLAGVLAPKPSAAASLRTGVVAALVAGNRLQVNVNGANITMRRGLHFTPAVGDVVLVATTDIGEAWAIMALATGTAPTPVPTPPAVPAGGSITWPALDAGTWRGARRTDRTDVLSGDDDGTGVNRGAWFYGDAIAATMTGLSLTTAQVFVDRRGGTPADPANISLYLHNSKTAPTSGDPVSVAGPTVIGAVAVGAAAWLPVPIAWINQIIAGTAAGLGIYTATAAPFVALASLTQSGQTGALNITWV
jgi:hypothetical protein